MIFPLIDMRRDALFSVDRVMSVARFDRDPRHSLGIPPFITTIEAVAEARRRGWKVLGVWQPRG